MTELIWEGKYKDGKKAAPIRIALPFQTIETVNESAQERQRMLGVERVQVYRILRPLVARGLIKKSTGRPVVYWLSL